MGAGSSALIWYGLCFAFVAFVVIVSTALIFYGQLVEARRAAARARAEDAPSPGTPPREGEAPAALDHESGDR